MHPEYAPKSISKQNDIAILKLGTRVNYTRFIRPICLPDREYDVEITEKTRMFVTGFGRTDLCEQPSVYE